MIEVKVDPTKEYAQQNKQVNMFNLTIVMDMLMHNEEDFKAAITEAYPYGANFTALSNDKAQVTTEGVYTYPEDPDLYPLAKFTSDTGQKAYFYPYDIIVINDECWGRID